MEIPTRGYKAKTIKAVLQKKFNAFCASIENEDVRKLVEKNTIITGGSIASMLLGEKVNDFDLTDPLVLQDQLTGVDSAYFLELMGKLKENDPERVNTAYLVEVIDRMF